MTATGLVGDDVIILVQQWKLYRLSLRMWTNRAINLPRVQTWIGKTFLWLADQYPP
jgi:hypothetical protein